MWHKVCVSTTKVQYGSTCTLSSNGTPSLEEPTKWNERNVLHHTVAARWLYRHQPASYNRECIHQHFCKLIYPDWCTWCQDRACDTLGYCAVHSHDLALRELHNAPECRALFLPEIPSFSTICAQNTAPCRDEAADWSPQ